jgi:hypothetical protein
LNRIPYDIQLRGILLDEGDDQTFYNAEGPEAGESRRPGSLCEMSVGDPQC